MASTRGRAVVIPLTNKSGGSVAAGDVVVIDTGNNDAFTTSTAGAVTGGVGIAQETIANNAAGRVLVHGYASLVNVSASVTRGNYGKTHTVAKQAVDAGSSRVAGAFCQFLTGGTTPTARVFSPDLGAAAGNVAVDAIWDAAGDLAVGTGADTAAKLTLGASGTLLKSNGSTAAWVIAPTFHGCKIFNAGTQSVNGTAAILFGSEEYDTDAYHDTGSNTSRITIPSGLAGKYDLNAGTTSDNSNIARMYWRKNGSTIIRGGFGFAGANGANGDRIITAKADLAVADYVELMVVTAAAANIGHASDLELESWAAVSLLGF